MAEDTVRIDVRLPRELIARLDANSQRLVVGRNKLIAIAVEDLVARLDSVEGRR